MKLTRKVFEMIFQGAYSTTSVTNGHHHEYKLDANGDGSTSFTLNGEEHQHVIKSNKVMSSKGHTHELGKENVNDAKE